MNSASVDPSWREAHNLDSDNVNTVNLIQTCAELQDWVTCPDAEDEVPCRRVFLQTSATQVAGAARIYKGKLQQFLEDLMAFDEALAKRNRIDPPSGIESTSSLITESLDDDGGDGSEDGHVSEDDSEDGQVSEDDSEDGHVN